MVISRGLENGGRHSSCISFVWKSNICSCVRLPLRIRYSTKAMLCLSSS
jgi:hypothetical protein